MIDDIIKKQDKCSEVLGQLFKSGITSNTSLIEHLISGLKKYGHDGAMAL